MKIKLIQIEVSAFKKNPTQCIENTHFLIKILLPI